MRAPACVVALLAATLAASALAQTASPEVTTLSGALDLRGAVERSSAHGCSQSYASSSDHAALRLRIDGRGAATLEADLEHHETFGPSPGRYAAGDHEVTHTTELGRAVLSGRATRTPEGLEVRFDRIERASVRFTGYGTLPLPPPTATALASTMRCRIARTDVLPRDWSEHERPTQLALLACTFDAIPAPLDTLEAPTLSFGEHTGVRTITEQQAWAYDATHAIRLAQ